MVLNIHRWIDRCIDRLDRQISLGKQVHCTAIVSKHVAFITCGMYVLNQQSTCIDASVHLKRIFGFGHKKQGEKSSEFLSLRFLCWSRQQLVQ